MSTPRFSPVWLVLVGIPSVQFGAVVSKGLFGEIDVVHSFVIKTRAEAVGVGGEGGRKNLHRNVATKGFVMSAVNDAHPAPADLLEDSVVRENLTNQGIHRTPRKYLRTHTP